MLSAIVGSKQDMRQDDADRVGLDRADCANSID